MLYLGLWLWESQILFSSWWLVLQVAVFSIPLCLGVLEQLDWQFWIVGEWQDVLIIVIVFHGLFLDYTDIYL